MARNRRTSPFEDLIEIASFLPYWLSLLLAIASYLILHDLATVEVGPVVTVGTGIPQNIGAMLLQNLTKFLQYIVPLAFCVGSAVSAFKAFKGRKLAEQYISTPDIGSFDSGQSRSSKPTDQMNWLQFELLIGQAFRQLGYRVIDGGEAGADGGVDVYLKKGGETFFVQCKHWKSKKVGVSVIRELYGVIAGAGASGGFVVTSGSFTEEAAAFAKGKRIDLIDGQKLDIMLRQAPAYIPEVSLRQPESEPEKPLCPRCKSTMVKRKARQGAYVGQNFWGCSRFPKCRGTQSVGNV
ncbi:restriction endonuclease [Marinobacterium jannaschii]|uniref:restriction endonuclease n=1 Tax=Marinobacterium jannaschii TaxID=64970 RepID=UPI0004871B39|nr:restriction endonuclease [Marinobacterium jannaschii]